MLFRSGATNATASYKVYQDEYSVGTDMGKLLWVRRFGFIKPLQLIGPEEMATLKNYDNSEGKPQVATLDDFATTGDNTTARRMVIHPYPDLAYRLEVHYKQALNTEISGTTRPLIPDDYVQLIIYGALAEGFPTFLNDVQRGAYYRSKFNDLMALMVAIQRERGADSPHLVPSDDYRSFYRRTRAGIPTSLGNLFDRYPTVIP